MLQKVCKHSQAGLKTVIRENRDALKHFHSPLENLLDTMQKSAAKKLP